MKKLIAFLSLCALLLSHPVSAGDADDYLILINAEHPLPADYSETYQEDFVEIAFTRNDGRPTQKMRREAAKALDEMLSAAKEAGFDITATSAYRSREYQKQLFDAAVESYLARGMTKKEALRLTKRYYALPGESEHESGLAADIHHLSCATLAFADTAEYRWLSENAHKYGYILRYPEGKEAVTGIAFEPWHFRYVGREAAEEIYRAGLCLEEFLKEKS
jgi:hypothetical protein